LAIGDFTMEDLGVCLLFLEVFKPLAGMTVGSTGVGRRLRGEGQELSLLKRIVQL
jgi:hypothetical protein